MAGSYHWARLGRVVTKHGSFKAEIDTKDEGERHYITGPPRGDDEQRASDDLLRIRASADCASTRFDGLQAMRITAKRLNDEAKMSRTSGPRLQAPRRWRGQNRLN